MSQIINVVNQTLSASKPAATIKKKKKTRTKSLSEVASIEDTEDAKGRDSRRNILEKTKGGKNNLKLLIMHTSLKKGQAAGG